MLTEFREVYCNNCKKSLGRYNARYFSEAKIVEIIKSTHTWHYKAGHQVEIRKISS